MKVGDQVTVSMTNGAFWGLASVTGIRDNDWSIKPGYVRVTFVKTGAVHQVPVQQLQLATDAAKDLDVKAMRAATKILFAITATIRDSGERGVPAGMLYCALSGHGYSHRAYNACIDVMLRSGVVEKRGDVLYWKGAPPEVDMGAASMMSKKGR